MAIHGSSGDAIALQAVRVLPVLICCGRLIFRQKPLWARRPGLVEWNETNTKGGLMLKLRITEGSNAGKEIAVNSSKFLIGRADECNLRHHSDAISRRHCVIIVTDKAVGVRDLKSRNGTVVNGEKIVGDKRLRHGDVLSVGPLSFEVIIKSKAEKPAKEDKKKRAATANAAAEGKGGEIGGMVSQWLEEADEFAKRRTEIGRAGNP